MSEVIKPQTCPYCESEVEDCHAVWDYEAEEEVVCDSCNKTYISKPQYVFEGWLIAKKCERCDEFTEDGQKLCDCEEYSESY